ncbi:MAG TPA: response regulator [Halobacteriales archaeon]|nr:response regulator [Halobacteriales archaeon]
MTRSNPAGSSDRPSSAGTVLAVDDEPAIVEIYENTLGAHYSVRTAGSGETALEKLSDDVDVVLLDRRMPGLSGDEVLEVVREEGYDCTVGMISAVQPDLDLVDLPFDAYATKPIGRRELLNLVEDLRVRSQLGDGVRELLAVVSKIAALESALSAGELSTDERYLALCERKEELRSTYDERVAQLIDEDGSEPALRDLVNAERIR